ncbi:MAG: hypothetical protein OXH11_04125, partial [Candidatus Aminicenantes bacterium]|nr:hypothetical protein [Candidatus Aminicenantes bacterium]
VQGSGLTCHEICREGEHSSQVSQRYEAAVTDFLLMTGRDRLRFKRWGVAFLRPGLARIDSWVSGEQRGSASDGTVEMPMMSK